MTNPKKVIYITLCGVLGLFLCTGCQTTPDKETVKQKNNGQVEKIIEDSESGTILSNYSVPSVINDNFQSDTNKLTVNIDADVIIPDVDMIPVVVAERAEFSQEMADQIMDGLFESHPIYKIREASDMTKQEIEGLMIRIKSGEGSDLAKADKNAYNEMVQPEIDQLEKQYQIAPDKYIPQEDDGKFKPFTPKISDAGMEGDNSQQEKYDAIRIKSSTPEGKEATLEIYSGKNISSMIVLYNREDREVNPDDGKVENVLNSQNLPTMSLEEAEDIANHLKNKMGFSDFILADYGATPTGAYSIAETYDDLGKCYVLYYMRTCGLPTNYVSNTLSASTYNFSWPQEVLTFYIDDQGVSEILYDSPTEFTETESEAVKILSFDEIMDIFQKQTIISTFTPPQGDEGIIGHKFDVTKIKLGSARVLVDINSGRYRYVPAWDFYGTWTYIYKEGSQYIQGVDENSEWKEDKFAQSYYTINAIDGSIIDRGVGY